MFIVSNVAFPQYRESGECSENVSYGYGTPTHHDLFNDTSFIFLGHYVQAVHRIDYKEKVEEVTEKVVRHDLLALILNVLSSSILNISIVCVLGGVYSVMKLFFPQ